MTVAIPAERHRILMTDAGLPATQQATARDEHGALKTLAIAGERPLTLYLNRHEVVTLMTLGTHPELLAIGYLRNQNLVPSVEVIEAVQVDWDVNAVAVTAPRVAEDFAARLERRTVTTGCGQGTVFGDILDKLDEIRLTPPALPQSSLYALLKNLTAYNETYRAAGAVHGCALCLGEQVIEFIEDVGRHNAVDAIAGKMWLEGIGGRDKLFYTTGRLTSEMVIKVAQMEIPILISRSGITEMGLAVARQVGVTLIARAKGRHFLVFNGDDTIVHDVPTQPSRAS